MPLSGLRVAVTGASGFVGAHLCRALLARGVRVLGVVRSPERGRFLEPLGVELRRADLSDPAQLQRAFEGAQALISNAALGGHGSALEEFVRTNLGGTENVLRAASAASVQRVVMISTVAVYRTQLLRAMAEESPAYPTDRRRFNWSDLTTDWRYAHSKTLAEARAWELARELGLELSTLRPGPVYGSRDPKLTARWLEQSRRALHVVPDVGVPVVHAGDVASAATECLTQPQSRGRAYNVAGPPVRLSRVFRILAALRRERGEPASQLLLGVPLPLGVAYDTRRAQRELGFHSRPLEAGLREVLEHDWPDAAADTAAAQ